MAEYCGEKAKKGRGVRVVGRLKQDTWKDENGKSASKVYVVAEHIEYKPMKKVEAEEAAKTQDAKTQDATPPEKTEAQTEPQTEAQPVPVEAEAVF